MEILLELDFLFRQAINLLLLCLIQYGNGLLVIHKNVKVNYTRKINHFLLFFIPIVVNIDFAYGEEFGLYAAGAALAVFKFVFYTRPVRERVPFINTMFCSFDRPEDRPYTLLWITTQTAAGHLVLIPMSMLFAHFDLLHLITIPIFIYGIGDGLAEPVGVRFGRHKYRVPALFTKKQYYRTLEGSACVFLTSLIVMLFYYPYFTHPQFVAGLVLVPVLMTLAEALSPHTWDSPLIFFTGCVSLLGIVFLL